MNDIIFNLNKTVISLSLLLIIAAGCTTPAQILTPADLKVVRPGASTLVVVHSRSGNTAFVGKTISELMSSDYIRLETPKGAGDSLLSSPNRNEDVEINPGKIDLKNYSLLFLGSPIWYWHANAYIYAFIKNNDCTGKKVVLFYTYEGGLTKDAIGEWSSLVQKQGGTVIDVIEINRRKLKTNDAMQAEVKTIIERKRSSWLNAGM